MNFSAESLRKRGGSSKFALAVENRYYKEMIDILLRHPEGVRVGALARAIYNNNCDLFHPETQTLFESIRRSTYSHLWRNSRNKRDPFVRKSWGVYALSKHFVRQLELCFDDWDDPMKPSPRQKTPKPDPYAGMRDIFADLG